MMEGRLPAHRRYYEALIGHWLGALSFRTTRFRGGGAQALPVKLAGALSPLLGGVVMKTTLEPAGDDFVHTTRVEKWGRPLLRSEERIVLESDGRSIRMHGEMQELGRGHAQYEATGTIAEAADGAEYRIPWLGTAMVQTTRVTAVGLELEQTTPFSFARVLLQRQA